ncbi:MAG: HAD family phosphatase [Methylocystis sp.]|nr:HAD family phosphatase [Methylocystis sp.]
MKSPSLELGIASARQQSAASCTQERHEAKPKSRRPDLLRCIDATTLEASLLDSELSFYGDYSDWLNPIPTVGEAVAHLSREVTRLETSLEPWQLNEAMTNVFLLSCTLLNSIDDYAHGPAYRVPNKASRLPGARLAQRALTLTEASTAVLRSARVARAGRWERQWQAGFDIFLQLLVGEAPRPEAVARSARQLSSLLLRPLPADLQAERIRVPSAFRKQDLTPFDIFALGRKFISRFPDRQQPILIVGLRTAGAYFAPLLRAFLKSEGYLDVDMATMRPKRGLAARERAELTRCARAGCLAVVIDEPPFSGATIAEGVEQLRKTGFHSDKLVILFPVRYRDWRAHVEATGFLDEVVICLEPEEWHKYRILASEVVEDRLREYFFRRNYAAATVVASPEADQYNARLLERSDANDRERLKRVFAVRLETRDGRIETRFVLAKGVGWGVFGYSAFLAGWRLAGLVPPLLGLRDGILYTEWLPQDQSHGAGAVQRSQWIERTADYVAARVGCLRLAADPTPELGVDPQHEGFRVLRLSLCKAYGSAIAAKLMGGRFLSRLSRRTCPNPTMIDGKMAPSEWIVGPSGLLKTDFEHHGFGKVELNVCDPAYDLADAVLQLELSPQEQRELIQRYANKTGDAGVQNRLFMNKLIAGSWLMASSLERALEPPQSERRAAEANKQYIQAWDFLTRECARFCGALCHRPQSPQWGARLVALDIDGVLDRRTFGFPTATAASIRALRLLHAHGFAVAVNTARSARQVKEYCSAYGFVGGVAEYGGYVFDAISGKGVRVASAAAMEQLEKLRAALRELPGVFLNDGYEYSIRAYAFERNRTVPLPAAMVPNLMSRLQLGRLRCFNTSIDTTVMAKDVDKGVGLRALLEAAKQRPLETVAIGDSEPDLAMFRVADRSFTPGKIGRPDLVQAIGGKVARAAAQRGLLEIVRSLIHPDGGSCPVCPPTELVCGAQDALFLDLLETADKNRLTLLLRALLHPKALRAFVQG